MIFKSLQTILLHKIDTRTMYSITYKLYAVENYFKCILNTQ